MIESPVTEIPLLSVSRTRAASRASKRAGSSVSAEEYANAIAIHAKQPTHRTLYPGTIYRDLGKYLQRRTPLSPRSLLIHGQNGPRLRSHATIHALDPKAGKAPTMFSDVDACCKEMTSNTSQRVPQIVFLRGLACPQWMNKVAANVQADPEFLNSTMQFCCRETYGAYPAPPSAYDNIIRIRIPTIGHRGRPDSRTVETLRAEAKEKMEQYRHELSNVNIACGDSIVRDYHVLSEQHFFIEQEVSVYLHSPGESAWTALICSDFGNSLAEGVRGPWLSDSDVQPGRVNTTEFFPTIQHRRKVAFRSKSLDEDLLEGANTRFAQTASLLPLDFGRLLDKSAMAADAFYALHDLFRFAIASDNQLLNLIDEYVRRDIGHDALTSDNPSLSNLVYYRELLENYLSHLKGSIEILRRRGGPQWPHASKKDRSSRNKVNVATQELLRDSVYLQSRAESIRKSCDGGMKVIMSNSLLAESKRAMAQAKKVARLTFVAFVYIPLSFTTSFFGMNLHELGTGPLPIWIWIATSVPVLSLTVLIFFLNVRQLKDAGRVAWANTKHVATVVANAAGHADRAEGAKLV